VLRHGLSSDSARLTLGVLSTDHVVLACGEEASALQARDRAMRELLKLHESFHQKGARARLGLGRVKPHH